MSPPNERAANRRLFLQFLAASPVLGSALREAFAGEAVSVMPRLPDPVAWGSFNAEALSKSPPIKTPQEALSVFDFEIAAREKVPLAHFAVMNGGSDDEITMRANRTDFARVRVRPRFLRDVSKVDSSVTLFGAKWDSPIFVCPTGGSNSMMHPDGHIGVSKAAEVGRHLQMLSLLGLGSVPFEDCIAARSGTPIWCQLYPAFGFESARDAVVRAERAGSPVLVLTIDEPVLPNFESFERLKRLDGRTCASCHQSSSGGTPEKWSASSNWDFVRRLRDITRMKVLIKGILAPQDAELCVKYGFDGVVVSSHGGKAGDFGTSSISVLPEIAAVAKGKMPILFDSGVRRGMDVVKALAMGATAVGIGRPYLWGLGAFGQAGVERVLEIMRAETRYAMAQVGAPTVKDLVPQMIHVDK